MIVGTTALGSQPPFSASRPYVGSQPKADMDRRPWANDAVRAKLLGLIPGSGPSARLSCLMCCGPEFQLDPMQVMHEPLGRVDKRDSHCPASVLQAGICNGDQLGTRPDVGRGMGVL
jgi:hypothetical protein